MDEDGWLRTGDLVSFDDEGYMYIVGRSKLLVSEPFRLEEPQDGFNTEYYHRQTEILQKKMKDMTDYFCILAQE